MEEFEVDTEGLAPGEMKAFRWGEISVLVCNVDGEFYALENRCSHADIPLDSGTLRGCELECISHGAVFDVRNGKALELPGRSSLRVFSAELTGRVLRIGPPRETRSP
ncbi:MAG: Rieske 2Fe-2S domain-containing protein [Myxococcota bacterium]|nr:Rieske 2Fe-2S domain-containing protein [Myxococcota bacterium]